MSKPSWKNKSPDTWSAQEVALYNVDRFEKLLAACKDPKACEILAASLKGYRNAAKSLSRMEAILDDLRSRKAP